MPAPDLPSAQASPLELERWFDELGLVPGTRIERDGAAAWDFILDGRRRFDIKMTVMLVPAAAAVVWVHYAPPIGDSQRRSYHKLLRWNDRFPFAKFSLAADERPILAAELPARMLDREELGLAVARLLAICDLLLEESAPWLWIGGRIPAAGDRTSRQVGLFARYAGALEELTSW